MYKDQTKHGVIFAISAYSIWGLVPLYFKSVQSVPAIEILCHRVIWSFLFLFIFLAYTKGWESVRVIVGDRPKLLTLMTASILIGTNWFVFIWATTNNYILDASLGYYINPILSVLLGLFFFKERLSPIQWIAVILAGLGIITQLIAFGSIPIIALLLAFSFGFYGLLRKKVNVTAFAGLFIETATLVPIALIYLLSANSSTSNLFNNPINLNLLLIFAGVITTIPLLFFTAAATRLRLATLGFIQYLGPTLSLLLAIFVFGEQFTFDKAISFGFIWVALIIFSYGSIKRNPNK